MQSNRLGNVVVNYLEPQRLPFAKTGLANQLQNNVID